jgi:tRNA C32,U32 (ribose-2'-O)-methylase TrmJ
VDFFKTRRSESVMRSLREILHRAQLDGREASLVRAMGIEVVRYLARAGVLATNGPAEHTSGATQHEEK